jgi:predicted RND superfamily exporter protein
VIRWLLAARYASTALVLVVFATLLAWGRHVDYEQSIQSFFSAEDPAVVNYQAASEAFGNDNVVFVCYDDPELMTAAGMERLAELAEALRPQHIEAVIGVESLDAMPLFWRIDDELIRIAKLPAFLRAGAAKLARKLVQNIDPAKGTMSVGGALRASDDSARKRLREKIIAHPMLQGTLVSRDGTSTAVVVRLKGMAEQDVKQTVAALRSAADSFASRHNLGRPALVGPPILLADGFTSIERDGQRLALVGMLLIGLVTLSATRSLWWAIVPILAGWTVWLAAETVLSLMHLKLSLSGGPLVAQIIVLTMPAASHLAIHFRDDLRREADRREAAASTLHAVTAPIIWCALTGTIGYGALLTSNVVPVRQFGAVLAVCTLMAAVLTLLISPIAMLSPFRLELPVRLGSTSPVASTLNAITAWVYRHPAPIVLGVLALVLPLASGAVRLHYESNYINAFKPDSRVVHDYHFVESRLGGIGLVSLVLPVGKTLDLETLEHVQKLDEGVREIGRGGAAGLSPVSRVVSLATVLDPDGRLAALPREQAAHALATKLDLIAATPQADLLRGFWNPQLSVARTLVRVPEQQEAIAKERTFLVATAQARRLFGPQAYLTGLSYLLTQTTRGVINTQWSTFFWSTGSIFVMLTLAFRGPILAILALLPTMLAVGLVLGLMGWLGVKLDLATALVASVALGLSVDDTFHCLLQYRRHRAVHDTFRESLFASYAVTGPGVLLSSLAVAIGFAVLRFSEFTPFSNFGTMVGIATLGSSLGNLMLLPACLTLGYRRLAATRERIGESEKSRVPDTAGSRSESTQG